MTTLTTEDRARLRDLADKATPGPWRVHDEAYEGMILAVGADEETVYATDADMALMGAARTAIPALLDALTTAEAARDTAERQVKAVRDVHEPIDAMHFAGRSQTIRKVCTGCGTDDGNWQIWPCPTIRALDGEAGR